MSAVVPPPAPPKAAIGRHARRATYVPVVPDGITWQRRTVIAWSVAAGLGTMSGWSVALALVLTR